MQQESPYKKGLSNNWAVREVDHLLGKLGHYTRFVGFSKWLLGVIALAMLVSLIAWPLLSKDREGVRISFTDSSTAQKPATSPVMTEPEYRGVNEKGEQYVLHGTRATQISQTMIVIDTMTAFLVRADNGWQSISADRGEYHQDTNVVDLIGSVTVSNDQDYIFITPQASINTKTSDIRGDQPISGKGPMGNILASSFEILDNGNHIIFKGGAKQVRVRILRKGTPA